MVHVQKKRILFSWQLPVTLSPGHLHLITTDDSPKQAFHRYHAIHATRAEPFEVESDELEAQGAEGRNQFAAELEFDKAS